MLKIRTPDFMSVYIYINSLLFNVYTLLDFNAINVTKNFHILHYILYIVHQAATNIDFGRL